jgi:hypothetical protein
MPELTLQDLAKRIDAIEQKLAELSLPTKSKDWRNVVGISEDNEFNRLVLAEIEANSEAERQNALKGNQE